MADEKKPEPKAKRSLYERKGEEAPAEKPAAKKPEPKTEEAAAPADNMHDRHAKDRGDMRKRHEDERRDLNGNHRDERRKMHDRHEADMKKMLANQESEMQAQRLVSKTAVARLLGRLLAPAQHPRLKRPQEADCMAWSALTDMELDDEDKHDAVMPMDMPSKPDYPYGLRICLTHRELEKLGLDAADCDVGDMVDLRAFAIVTSKSTSDDGDGENCRIELQIQKLAVENEMTEDTSKE